VWFLKSREFVEAAQLVDHQDHEHGDDTQVQDPLEYVVRAEMVRG
jgi:hypothetical protein